ncbi:hypothetical protein GR927_30230 [Mycolicibacterium sp. 3033]|nr:hypothetical protein [Mycolicibacterium aurantiacum]
MSVPTADDVLGLLRKSSDEVDGQVSAALAIVSAMASAYTRGRGFNMYGEPNPEISAVIITAAARLASNASQLSRSETTGPFSQDIRGSFQGWTLAEQFVLNRYRVRAM